MNKNNQASKKNKTANIIIALVVFSLFMCVRALVYPRLFAWTCIIALCVSLISLVFIGKGQDNKEIIKNVVFYVGIFAIINLIGLSSDYHFINGSPFWIISIVFGLIISGVVIYKVFGKHNYKNDTNKNTGGMVVLFLVVALFACVGIRSVIVNLNCVLDTKAPEKCEAVIKDKRQINRRKGTDSYEFKISVDGDTFYLDVPYSDFHKYDSGDIYRFTKYQGALDQSFYIAGTEE